MYIVSRAPNSSYYYMSGAGDTNVAVNVEPAPVVDPPVNSVSHDDHSALASRVEGVETRLDNILEEAKTWSKKEIAEALSRLENLEATATEGMKNLADQVKEIREQLQGMLTRKSQEPPPEPITEPPQEIPPVTPPDQQLTPPEPKSGAGDAPGKTASHPDQGPQAPQNRKRRVV